MVSISGKEVNKGKVEVFVIPNESYTKKIVEITKGFSEGMETVCYINLNKMYDSLERVLKSENIDFENFMFIDGITKSANPEAKEPENCFYLESASNLIELSILIDKLISTNKFEAFLFDSLSTLLIYNPEDVVSKFVRDLINKFKAHDTTVVFTALSGDTKSGLLNEVGMFVDGISHLEN